LVTIRNGQPLFRNKHHKGYSKTNTKTSFFFIPEFSQRYAVPDLGFEFKEARLQDEKNRQNSIETDNVGLQLNWETQQDYVIAAAEKHIVGLQNMVLLKNKQEQFYQKVIQYQDCICTEPLRSWVHYIQLRSVTVHKRNTVK
jgi:thymidylate synthase (FAD)